MTAEDLTDLEPFELRLPVWAVTDEEGFCQRGLPGCLRAFLHDVHGPFLDLFTEEGIAKGYIRKAGFSRWRTVELAIPAQVRIAVLACEQSKYGCLCVGLDCTGQRDGSGQFLTIRQFLDLLDRLE